MESETPSTPEQQEELQKARINAIRNRHFKCIFLVQNLLPFKFFRDFIKTKGPNLAALVLESVQCGYDFKIVTHEKIRQAFVNDIPDWAVWFEQFFAELVALNNAVQVMRSISVNTDLVNNQIHVNVAHTANPTPTPKTLDQLKKPDMLKAGPPIWKSLHSFALTWDGNIDGQKLFFQGVTRNIPCGECKNFWIKENRENPAPTDSAENLFKWTVDIHNKVNVKLGKAEMSLEEAKTLY